MLEELSRREVACCCCCRCCCCLLLLLPLLPLLLLLAAAAASCCCCCCRCYHCLPPLTDESIAKEIDYMLAKGWVPCLEFDQVGYVHRTNNNIPGYYDGRYQSNGDVASDGYHKYKEDVKLISEVGLEAYRFSISWSRLLPNGRGAVNPKALEYYNNLINELVYHGIELHATLSHLDFPQILEDEYEGWLSPKIVEDFTAFADVCFREFGDRISHWTTVNEPNIMAISSYGYGQFPPRRCSPPGAYNCSAGNSSVEPYKAMHNILLAHSSIVTMYRDKYQAKQNGLIGMNTYAMWCTPMTNSTVDVQATQRANDFFIGWVINPIIYGDYPEIMKKNVGSRLPSFTKQESELLKGSFDLPNYQMLISDAWPLAMYTSHSACPS